jgi:hypothetical protein
MPPVIDRIKLVGLRIADPRESSGTRIVTFGLFILAIGCLLLLVRLFVLQQTEPHATSVLLISAQNVCDNLIASCIIVFAASLLLVALSSSGVEHEDLTTLSPWHIHPTLLEPLPTTVNYWFRGRSGRFFRGSVLPALVGSSKRNASTRRVHIVLPDPGNQTMLERYAAYRNSLRFEKQGAWTARRVQIEIYATILAIAEQTSLNQFFTADVAVGQDYALFRIDMSDERMVMTREDPQWPGFMCSRHSRFYSSYQEEIRLGMSFGRKLRVEGYPPRTVLDETNISAAAVAIGLDPVDDLALAREIIRAIRQPQDPYV